MSFYEIHIHTYKHTYICTYTQIHKHVPTDIHPDTWMDKCTHMHAHAHARARIQTFRHIHTQTCIHS